MEEDETVRLSWYVVNTRVCLNNIHDLHMLQSCEQWTLSIYVPIMHSYMFNKQDN